METLSLGYRINASYPDLHVTTIIRTPELIAEILSRDGWETHLTATQTDWLHYHIQEFEAKLTEGTNYNICIVGYKAIKKDEQPDQIGHIVTAIVNDELRVYLFIPVSNEKLRVFRDGEMLEINFVDYDAYRSVLLSM